MFNKMKSKPYIIERVKTFEFFRSENFEIWLIDNVKKCAVIMGLKLKPLLRLNSP